MHLRPVLLPIMPNFHRCRGATGQPPNNPICPLDQSMSDTAGEQVIRLESGDDISKPFLLWAPQDDM